MANKTFGTLINRLRAAQPQESDSWPGRKSRSQDSAGRNVARTPTPWDVKGEANVAGTATRVAALQHVQEPTFARSLRNCDFEDVWLLDALPSSNGEISCAASQFPKAISADWRSSPPDGQSGLGAPEAPKSPMGSIRGCRGKEIRDTLRAHHQLSAPVLRRSRGCGKHYSFPHGAIASLLRG